MNNYFLVCVIGMGKHSHAIVIGLVKEDGIYAIFTDAAGREIYRCLTACYQQIDREDALKIQQYGDRLSHEQHSSHKKS